MHSYSLSPSCSEVLGRVLKRCSKPPPLSSVGDYMADVVPSAVQLALLEMALDLPYKGSNLYK